MRILPLLLAAGLITACTDSQPPTTNLAADELSLVQDQLALKRLVDDFSVLADRKDVAGQMELFTDDATVTSYRSGQAGRPLVGKDSIGTAFANFLDLFDVVYHHNGQQTVEIDGDEATGVAYCLVVLIRQDAEGQSVKRTMGVRYDDRYRRVDGKWLIAERRSYFEWEGE